MARSFLAACVIAMWLALGCSSAAPPATSDSAPPPPETTLPTQVAPSEPTVAPPVSVADSDRWAPRPPGSGAGDTARPDPNRTFEPTPTPVIMYRPPENGQQAPGPALSATQQALGSLPPLMPTAAPSAPVVPTPTPTPPRISVTPIPTKPALEAQGPRPDCSGRPRERGRGGACRLDRPARL